MNSNRFTTSAFSNPKSRLSFDRKWSDEPQVLKKYEHGEHCDGCAFFTPFNAEWGLCCHRKSRHHLETVFVQFTCPNYVQERQDAPRQDAPGEEAPRQDAPRPSEAPSPPVAEEITCPSLNLLVLRSPDLARAEDFYTRLGLSFSRHRHGSGPEHLSAEFAGEMVFELYPQAADAPTTLGTLLGFRVLSLEATLAALADYPNAIISPPKASEWGRRAIIADPDGHRIRLLEV
jgi:lactoylglutathione lyase